jgi:hypothetical protein
LNDDRRQRDEADDSPAHNAEATILEYLEVEDDEGDFDETERDDVEVPADIDYMR